MHFGAPQWIWAVTTFLYLALVSASDGRPRTDKWSFGTAFVGAILTFGLLYWGGFFRGS